MDQVSSLLSVVLRKRGLMDHATAALVTHRASCWLAEHLAHCADVLHVRSCKHGVLCIEAEHSIAAQECQMSADALLEYLHAEGHSTVQQVRTTRSMPATAPRPDDATE